MKKIITLCTVLLISCFFHSAFAQEREISGKVTTKDDNKPLPGVTIMVKGTTLGAATDLDGNYVIKGVPPTAKMLTFSAVGMKTAEVEIGASNVMDLVMEPDVLKLDEVVVTAVGISQEKKALSYATQTVNGSDLGQSGGGNVLNELSGKVSNLNVISSTGDPGAGTYINLRGPRLLTGDNQPLMIVDGVPMDNSINAFDPTNGGNPSNGPFSNVTGGVSTDNRGIDINPNDIESITVLKGPAATALYGIQAASGALIITTKKGGGLGKKGPSVSFSSSTGWMSTNKLPEIQTEFAQGSDGVYASPTSAGVPKRWSYGPAVSSLVRSGTPSVWDPNGDVVPAGTAGAVAAKAYNSEDFFVVGTTLDNNISLAGGNTNTGYRMSIGNLHQNGVAPKSGYDKTTINLSGNSNLTNKLSASGVVTYVTSIRDAVQQGSNTSGLMLGLLRTPPSFDNAYGFESSDAADTTASYVQPNGQQRDYRGGAGYDNPYWVVNRNPYHQNVDRIFGSVEANYKLYDWMTLTYRLGGDYYLQSAKNGFDIYSNAFPAGAIYLNDWTNSQYNSDFLVNMNKRFNSDWTGSLVLGHNYFTSFSSQRQQQGNSFAIPTWFDVGNASSFVTSEAESKIRRMAVYAQAQVGWKEQLYLTVTGRDEISSTLPADNNVFFYPSASVGWVFTELLGLSTNKTFSYGKLRVSYAQVGKDAPAQALTTPYGPTVVSNGFTTNGGLSWPFEGVPGYSNSNPNRVFGNPTLKPYKTTAYEIGADLSFFQNRISLEATYYDDKTTDEIFTVSIPYSAGNGAIILNAGEITNKGIELSLKTVPVKTKGGLQWNLDINWSHNDNLVTKLYPGVETLLLGGFTNGGVYAVEGKPFGEIFGSTYVRTSAKDVNSPMLINDDKSDPGYAMPIPGSENLPLGSIQPDWLGAVVSDLSYKGITLGFQVDVRQGGKVWNGTRGAMGYFGTAKETDVRNSGSKVFEGVFGHLNADGEVVHFASDGVTEIAGAGSANTSFAAPLNQYYWQNVGNSFVGPTETTVEDGSYIKLRQVSLTWAFPKSWVDKMHFDNFAITVYANNIILNTDYTGVDPETSLGGPSNGQGLDYFNNPGVKIIGFRVTAGL